MDLSIFLLGKLPAPTDNVPYCLVDSLHNLHSSVSDALSMLCLTEFALKASYHLLLFSKLVIFIKKALLYHSARACPI